MSPREKLQTKQKYIIYFFRAPGNYPCLGHGITIDKKIMRQGMMRNNAFQSSLETMDFGKIYIGQGILLAIFYATGYKVWRDLPHTPVTSLVK